MNISQFAEAGWVVSGFAYLNQTADMLKSMWEAKMEWHKKLLEEWPKKLEAAGLSDWTPQFDGHGKYSAKLHQYLYHPPAKPPQFVGTDKLLEDMKAQLAGKRGIILGTTNSNLNSYVQSCLLKELGFRRAGRRCKMNSMHSLGTTDNPAIADGRSHWTHIWYLLQDPPEALKPTNAPVLNGCANYGVLGSTTGVAAPYIGVAVVPTKDKLPDGWRSFYRFSDYKLAHNLDLPESQVCPHKFLLSEFDDWKPTIPETNYGGVLY